KQCLLVKVDLQHFFSVPRLRVEGRTRKVQDRGPMKNYELPGYPRRFRYGLGVFGNMQQAATGDDDVKRSRTVPQAGRIFHLEFKRRVVLFRHLNESWRKVAALVNDLKVLALQDLGVKPAGTAHFEEASAGKPRNVMRKSFYQGVENWTGLSGAVGSQF